jgi:hypothetical protein
LAAKAVAEKIERISVDTFRLTMGEPVQGWEGFLTKTTPPYIQYVIYHGETNYLGDQNNNTRYVTRYVTPVDPNGRFAIQWEWKETAVLSAMDNVNLKEDLVLLF